MFNLNCSIKTSKTLFYVPEGFRPPKALYAACVAQYSGGIIKDTWRVGVMADGAVKVITLGTDTATVIRGAISYYVS